MSPILLASIVFTVFMLTLIGVFVAIGGSVREFFGEFFGGLGEMAVEVLGMAVLSALCLGLFAGVAWLIAG